MGLVFLPAAFGFLTFGLVVFLVDFLGVFDLEAAFFPDDPLAALAFLSLAGVAALAGEAGATAGVSTFGTSATGSALALVTFGLAAFLAAFGLLADLALDLLAFCD